MSLQGMVPVPQQMQAQIPVSQMMGMQMSGQVATSVKEQEPDVVVSGDTRDNRNYTQEDVKKYEMEPELNELLDFSFCGD